MTRSKIRTSGAEGLTLSSTQLTIADGLVLTDGNIAFANGHGCNFSSTSDSSGSMQNELLDDYEEGTWTPALTAGDGGSSIISGTNTASYTRMGRLIYLQLRTNCSSSSSDQLYITGLPFSNAGGNAQHGTIAEHGVVGGSCYASSTTSFAVYNNDGGTFTAANASGILRGTIIYQTS